LLPPIFLLGAETAFGLVLGVFLRRMWALPIAAVVTFGATLLLYMTTFSQFVVVGGVTDSLVGLRPRASVEIAQLATYSAFGLTACVIAASRPERLVHCLVRGLPLPAGLAALVATVGWLAALGANVLEPYPTALRCSQVAPQICVAPRVHRPERAPMTSWPSISTRCAPPESPTCPHDSSRTPNPVVGRSAR
jgi:hypothetical protein